MKLLSLFGINQLKLFFKNNFNRWLAKRIPSQKEHRLNSSNILIYPTRFGLGYLAIVTLIFLLGTNYQNNIILLLSYLLASFFISVMLHSFYNFSQLQFHSDAKQQGYCGEVLLFPITITAQKLHFDINIVFSDQKLIEQKRTDKIELAQCNQGTQVITLPYRAVKRGMHDVGRVTVFSEYSLGIFKSKTVLDFGHHVIAYPKPKNLSLGQYQLSNQVDEPSIENYQESRLSGTDDFSELKSFVVGESKSRTAWKQLAKGQGHYSKHYQASQGKLQWLKLIDMPGSDIEVRLSYLSFLINELSHSNQVFGLELDNQNINSAMNIPPSCGVEHQQACLVALALYP